MQKTGVAWQAGHLASTWAWLVTLISWPLQSYVKSLHDAQKLAQAWILVPNTLAGSSDSSWTL